MVMYEVIVGMTTVGRAGKACALGASLILDNSS